MIELTGRLLCRSDEDAALVRRHLPDHLRLTREEPGCLHFDVVEVEPLILTVSERFVDAAAFAAHQARTRKSAWGRATAGIPRDYCMRKT